MPDINLLKSTYFLQAADANTPQVELPPTYDGGSTITPLIDCDEYNKEIENALNIVGNGPDKASNKDHFILIANWWLGLKGGKYEPGGTLSELIWPSGPKVRATEDDYYLDGPDHKDPQKNLSKILKVKAQKGVDVRVMGWVSPFIMWLPFVRNHPEGANYARVNAITIKSIKDLRGEKEIGIKKAVFNVLGHIAGAIHTKLVVIGDGKNEVIGFTGGLDFAMSRWATHDHIEKEIWHDVVAKVEGRAAAALYDYFRPMWNDNIFRTPKTLLFEGEEVMSHFQGETFLPSREFSITPKGNQHVQSLSTIPVFNYKWNGASSFGLPISFAPKGRFQIAAAWRKAIKNANTYIYMEDQGFYSREILSWINDAVRKNINLRVILVTSGSSDPDDPNLPNQQILHNSINKGLLKDLSATQRKQIRMFKRWGDTQHKQLQIKEVTDQGTSYRVETDLTVKNSLSENYFEDLRAWLRGMLREYTLKITGNEEIVDEGEITFIVEKLPGSNAPVEGTVAEFLGQRGIIIHSKTTLIDDHWAIIGSANCFRRSLYTDWEHAVSFIDEDNVKVKEYRKKLWNEHFRHSNSEDFDDIQKALRVWESTWGVAGAPISKPSRPAGDPADPPYIEPVTLPVPIAPFTDDIKKKYDRFIDPDSREKWGLF